MKYLPLVRTSGFILWVLFFSGCAGYAGSVADMRRSLLTGDKAGALKQVNKALDVKTPEDYPEKLKGENLLLILERAMIKQGLDQMKSSAKDFGLADKHLEMLDFKNDTMGNIGKFIFSDDMSIYKAPPYEKLLLNTFNMLNYLSTGNLEAARVESRRLQVMQEYLSDEGSKQSELLGLGSYLAGFAFEMSGQNEKALTFYGDALGNYQYNSLVKPIQRLASCTSYSNDTIDSFLKDSGVERTTCPPKQTGTGTILVVSAFGLAPYKEPKRFPIGPAMVLAAAFLGAGETAQARKLMARGLLVWVNFPVLERTPERFTRIETQVDGAEVQTEMGLDVTEKVIAAWDSIKGKLMAAAIIRLIARLAAGIATEKAVAKSSGSELGGLLAGLAVQGTMTAMDTPDTRSWVSLPSKVMLSRTEVPAGSHDITITFEGGGVRHQEQKTVNVPDGGFAVVVANTMR